MRVSAEASDGWRGSVRKRVVAEKDSGHKDYSEREHLLGGLQVKLKQTTACNATGAIGEPASKGRYAGFPATSVCSSLWCGWLRWGHSSAEADEVQRAAAKAQEARGEYEEAMGDYELSVGLREGKRESAWISVCRPRMLHLALLVDARQHDEAVHEEQAKRATADKEDEDSNPDLPAYPRAKKEGSRAAPLPEAAKYVASSADIVADQGADAAGGLEVVVLVLALGGASIARVRAVAAAADVYEGHRRLQVLRVLRRVAAPRRLHLGVELNVGVVGVVNGAGAVVAAAGVAVLSFFVLGEVHGAARQIAEEIERLAERVLGGPRECARRVHRVGFMVGAKGSDCMLTTLSIGKS